MVLDWQWKVQEEEESEPTPKNRVKQEVAEQRTRPTAIEEQNNNGSNTPKDALFSRPRNRMPYFRWLGPTAIMPGFKQMVVKVKHGDGDRARSSTDGKSSPAVNSL